MAAIDVAKVVSLTSQLIAIPARFMSSTYDKEADVLYLNFKKPSHADNSELTDDDLIVRYEKGKVVGVTVLNASKRSPWIPSAIVRRGARKTKC